MMRSVCNARALLRVAALAGGVALLPMLTGCGGDKYHDTLTYGVRTDWMVTSLPKQQPVGFNRPGKMPLAFLDDLPRVFDSTKKVRAVDLSLADLEIEADKRAADAGQRALIEEAKNNILDPSTLTADERKAVGDVLTDLFGTPARPKVKAKEGEALGYEPAFIEKLKLDEKTLAEGSSLYRRHCLHCHGLEGNGRGPTGHWVNPHPRDYRQGVFKFTSSSQDLGERKPRRADIVHVLQNGIEGSSMPSFGVLPKDELEKIASYVIHLSVRGELEYFVLQQWLTGTSRLHDKASPADYNGAKQAQQDRVALLRQVHPIRISKAQADGKSAAEIDAMRKSQADELKKAQEDGDKELKAVNAVTPSTDDEKKKAVEELKGLFAEPLPAFAARWATAQDSAIQADPYPYDDADPVKRDEKFLASAVRGATLFNAGTASCVSCHKGYGREAPYSYDAWGTVVRPRNLVDGYYRGGRRPIDLYYRVYSGINGAGMASYANELRPNDDDKAKGQDKIWDLVNFMQALNYPNLRKALREKGVDIDTPQANDLNRAHSPKAH